MDLFSLALLAIAVLGLGSAFTVLVAWYTPLSFAEHAAEHGRFVGLGEELADRADQAVPHGAFSNMRA